MELLITFAAAAVVVGLGLWLSNRKKEGKGGDNPRKPNPTKPDYKEK
jgi:hypothetical protein